MEEDRILAGFHQVVQKAKDKSWHDIHIKRKSFKEGDLVLLYDSKVLQHPGKFIIHCLGPYEVNTVTDGGICTTKGSRRSRDERNDQWESTETVHG